MIVEYINYDESIANYKVVYDENEVISQVINEFTTTDLKILVLKETWLTQKEFEDLIKNKTFDLLIAVSLMDDSHLDLSRFKNIIKIGYYKDSTFWYDFHATLVYKYMDTSKLLGKIPKTIPFMCLNGKPHDHRIEIMEEFKKNKLLKRGFISFAAKEINIPNRKVVDDFLPNNVIPTPYNPYEFGNINAWNSHFLNVITETLPDPSLSFFWSEKTFKPIVGLRPFLVYAPDGNLPMLKHFKFEPYVDDFTDICSYDLSIKSNIVPFLSILSKQHQKYFNKKYKNLMDKMLYNRNNFYNHVNKQKEIFKNLKNYKNFS